MPFVAKTRRQALKFNLDDAEERQRYEEVLNNPAMKVLTKKHVQQTETTYDGDAETSATELHLYLEVEECTL